MSEKLKPYLRRIYTVQFSTAGLAVALVETFTIPADTRIYYLMAIDNVEVALYTFLA